MTPFDQHDEATLGELMRAKWATDNAILDQQGRAKPWLPEPEQLDQDEARALAAIADATQLAWGSPTSQERKASIKAMGLNQISNAKHVLDKLTQARLLDFGMCPVHNVPVVRLSMRGRDSLDDYEEEVKWG